MKTEQEIQAEIDRLEAELKRIQMEKKKLESPLQELAILLHDKLCRWNHTDGCGWYYQISNENGHDWCGYEHGRYLTKARNISKLCAKHDIKIETVLEFYDELEK